MRKLRKKVHVLNIVLNFSIICVCFLSSRSSLLSEEGCRLWWRCLCVWTPPPGSSTPCSTGAHPDHSQSCREEEAQCEQIHRQQLGMKPMDELRTEASILWLLGSVCSVSSCSPGSVSGCHRLVYGWPFSLWSAVKHQQSSIFTFHFNSIMRNLIQSTCYIFTR